MAASRLRTVSWGREGTSMPPAPRGRAASDLDCRFSRPAGSVVARVSCGRTWSLSAVAGFFAFYGVGDTVRSGGGEPERLSAVPVSDNFFQVLGVQPALGRTFSPEETKWRGPKAVMLSHALWVRRFASD